MHLNIWSPVLRQQSKRFPKGNRGIRLILDKYIFLMAIIKIPVFVQKVGKKRTFLPKQKEDTSFCHVSRGEYWCGVSLGGHVDAAALSRLMRLSLDVVSSGRL